ncbi:hypothetical protein EZV62_019382 [Acer yangbiense]|uniref:Uncharacterized protein n=1 Tax=Acer yangbiense TaxID=1000413 RepID=A0A5C7HD46_9ROSI|nr:hypothetical protein EZV62_019382 [Acer yangbiense]
MDPDNLDVEDINSESMEDDYDGGETQVEEDQEINDLGKRKVKTLGKKPPRQRKSTSKTSKSRETILIGQVEMQEALEVNRLSTMARRQFHA